MKGKTRPLGRPGKPAVPLTGTAGPERWILGGSLFFAVALLALVWAACGHGIDLTDEGFYLVWMRKPWEFASSVYQFGFVYHPLYRLVHGDVADLRRASVGLSLGCGALFTWVHLRRRGDLRGWGGWLWAAAGLLATQVLLQHMTCMPTPSYNTLALQGMLLAAAGAGLLVEDRARGGAFLVGLGLVLTGFGKPTSAVVLAVLLWARLGMEGPAVRRRSLWALAWMAILGLAGAYAISGGVLPFVHRLQLGLTEQQTYKAGYSFLRMFRLDRPDLTVQEKGWCVGGGVLIAALAWVGHRQAKAGTVLVLAALSAAAAALAGAWRSGLAHTHLAGGLVGAAVPIGAALTWAIRGRGEGLPKRPQVLDALFLLALPWAYAFGTNRNYWMNEAFAVLFWSVALLVALPGALGRRVLPAAAGVGLALTGLLLQAAAGQPFRQASPLFEQRFPVAYGAEGATLLLDGAQRDYFAALRSAAVAQGFVPDTPVLDLTGHSPGILHGLGATSVASPWFAGDYPGGQDVAALVVGRVPCGQLARTWLLTEPAGPRRIDLKLLAKFGLDLDRDYERVITLDSPKDSRGYPGSEVQSLYRPRNPAALSARCGPDKGGHR